MHQKQIFELPLTMICASMGISMVAIFSLSAQKWPNGAHFSSPNCINWPKIANNLETVRTMIPKCIMDAQETTHWMSRGFDYFDPLWVGTPKNRFKNKKCQISPKMVLGTFQKFPEQKKETLLIHLCSGYYICPCYTEKLCYSGPHYNYTPLY